MSRCGFYGALAAAVLATCGVGAAEEAGAGSAPVAAPAPDKSAYSLCNPTPPDQMREMDQDRPNKVNTPHTIDAGHLQVETGLADYLFFRDHSHGADVRTDTWALGQPNFRLGVLDNLEVNAAFTAYSFLRFHDYVADQTSRRRGFGDTVVGGKVNFWGNDGADGAWATALAIQPQVKLPTAGRDLGNGHAEFLANVPLQINLPAEFHLGLQTTPALERTSDNTGYTAGWANAICVDRVIFEKFDVYLEGASHLTGERHQEGQGTVDVGVVYQLTRNVSLDTGVNLGVNRASPKAEWFVGMSVRF